MIPLDILGLIFAEYGKQESLDSPLETLLLVCKDWKDLCLSLKVLWSSFHIDFGTAIEAKKWASLVPKRLERSGSSTPIHAVIMNNRKQAHRYRDPETGGMEHHRCPELVGRPIFDPDTPCSCHSDILGHVANILGALAGSEGQMCHRWVTICLSLHTRASNRMEYFWPLTYPTPNLRTLVLQGLDSSWVGAAMLTLFPSTPSLSDLSLQHSNLPHIHKGLFQAALHLKRLELQDYIVSALAFPATLPSLATLVIRGNWWHRANSPISVPKLTCLTREMTALTLQKPFDCFVVPFENLVTLGIFYYGRLPLPAVGSAFTAAITKLLMQANNVKTIAGDEFSIMTLFLILSTSPLPRGLYLTTDQLKICIMDRRHAGRIEWALGSGDGVFTIDMGEHMMRDMESIKERKGWANW